MAKLICAESDAAFSADTPIRPERISDLVRRYPEMRPILIDGILRRGETANIIASPKVGKSFLACTLAWCVAQGRPWLSYPVTRGKVLIIDNELHPETIANRLYCIAAQMQIDAADNNEIDVICLRGKNLDIHSLESRLAAIERGTYSLVIVDALYRTLPTGTSENDNAAMMAIYNRLDHYAAKWDAAIAIVHHSSKGNQSDKSITDVGSGAGAISRAADTHIVIRPHEKDDLCVLECVTRSFKSPKSVSIKFTWPLWEAVPTPAEVRRVGTSPEAKANQDKQEANELFEKIPLSPNEIQQIDLFDQFPFGVAKCKRLIGQLLRERRVKLSKRTKGGRKKYVFYCRSESSSDVVPV